MKSFPVTCWTETMRRGLVGLLRVLLTATFVGSVHANASDDTDELARQMIELIEAISLRRYPTGVVKRFNQPKTLGCFNAQLEVHPQLSPALAQGLFAQPGLYKARVRFANASQFDDREKDIRGMSIKVYGVDGTTLLRADGEQDFVLNSYPALFAATPEDFLTFIQAAHKDRLWWYFLNPLDPHLKSLWILYKARQRHTNPFAIQYFSTTAFRLGSPESTPVKYSARPCGGAAQGSEPTPSTADHLRDAMVLQLEQGPACFSFAVQFQTNGTDMPIEDASVIWNEDESPFRTVATLTIFGQDFTSHESLTACESLSFNPWQSLAAHQPLGRMNQVREEVYAASSRFRERVNEERSNAFGP